MPIQAIKGYRWCTSRLNMARGFRHKKYGCSVSLLFSFLSFPLMGRVQSNTTGFSFAPPAALMLLFELTHRIPVSTDTAILSAKLLGRGYPCIRGYPQFIEQFWLVCTDETTLIRPDGPTCPIDKL